jgi:hypothetical protein
LCAAFAGPCAFAATIDIGGPRVPQVAGVSVSNTAIENNHAPVNGNVESANNEYGVGPALV